MAKNDDQRTGYGTFEGVFVPTLLTILGVIMYLRLGWVTGNAGLGGAIVIISIAFGITGATALSMSSVATNVRIGAGGAYAIIARSLGLEVGGSIGIPLYLSQALAVAMYVFGFREGWLRIFPDHPALVIDIGTFIVIVGIASISAALAFRTQYLILALILGSLVSIAIAAFGGSMSEPITWFGDYPGEAPDFGGTGFWNVFAVFFPAATGIMAGANLSGELADPRRSIPRGTLGAVGVSLVVYLILAVWLAMSASAEELVTNFNVMLDQAAWGPAVTAGLLGATFSSALSSTVGAPRILAALGASRIFPGGTWLAKTSGGEPRRATLVTAVIVIAALMLRDLNAVAPLITMFFLITYAMLNLVVLIEQRLGLVSFRPSLRVWPIVPIVGTVGCVVVMFIINPVFGLAAVVVVVLFYLYLSRRHLQSPETDVRSGLFVALSEWAAKRVYRLPSADDRSWKPNFLVPVADVRELRGTFRLIRSMAHPKGSVKMLGFAPSAPARRESIRIERLTAAFRDDDVFASWNDIGADRVGPAFIHAMDALGTAFFKPNVVFLTAGDGEHRTEDVRLIAEAAPRNDIGVALFVDHPQAHLGRRRAINVWFPQAAAPLDPTGGEAGEMDLAILLAYRIHQNWNGRLRLVAVVDDESEKQGARDHLASIERRARLPVTETVVVAGGASAVQNVPQADLGIWHLPEGWTPEALDEMVGSTRAAAIFCRDGGIENALV